jgi:hypothetical protein
MSDGMMLALIGAGAAIIGGILSGVFPWFVDWYSRPILEISYEDKENEFWLLGEWDVKIGEKEGKPLRERRHFVVYRARIRNKGYRQANNCVVYLEDLDEVTGAKVIREHVMCDSKQLPWAGYDWKPRTIPSGPSFFTDFMHFSRDNDQGWLFICSLFEDQKDPLKKFKGTYRLHLLVTADNANPARCSVDVEYRGEYRNIRAWKSG